MGASNNSINNTVKRGNFSVNQNTAATPVVCTVSHTDNTSITSNANFIISTGGTSSGNPFITYTVTGSTSWTTGIDQADSQNYKISQGTIVATNTAVQIDGSGRINYPLQSAFSAYLSTTGTVANVTGDGTSLTLTYDVEVLDQANNYNPGTGIFTAPIDGVYYFIGAVFITNLSSIHTVGYLDIITSGSSSQLFRLCKLNPFDYSVPQGTPVFSEVLSGGTYIQLVKNDTAKLVITVANGTKTVGLQGIPSALNATATYFQGYLAH